MGKSLTSSRIKLRHIQCFLAVAQLGSLQRASERLSITQPAVSKTLLELESLLGVRLFHRGRQGAELTSEGRVFAPYANACLASLDEGVGKLASDQESTPEMIRLGILPTVASVLLPSALRTFYTEWPQVSLDVVTGRNVELLERLRSADIAFAVARMGEADAMSGMSFEHLFREPLSTVVRADHPLLDAGALTPEAIGTQLLLLPPAGTLIRQSAESILARFGATVHGRTVESLSVSLNLALTRTADAIWFVPDSLVAEQVEQGELVRLSMPLTGTDEPMGLLRRTDVDASPAAESLIKAIRQAGLARAQSMPMTH